jgi:polyhydroxyalkanoate synthesis regulator phasin
MMAKKAKQESQEEQSERFRKLVQDMVDAGELNPTDAEERFEKAMRNVRDTSKASQK